MKKGLLLSFIMALILMPSVAQKKNAAPIHTAKTEESYIFTPVIDLKATSVKNQSATGTCWCFATTSFIESELLRMDKGEYDLSEMFMIRQNDIDMLNNNYLRRGNGHLGEGGNSHDYFKVFSEVGVVPEDVYTGLTYGSTNHNHGELQDFIKAIAAVPVQRKNQSKQYFQIVDDLLETFTYKGMTYSPKSFAASLGINPDDYVEITSFTHFPFYSQGVLEITDNWRMASFFNVTIDELIEIIDYSFAKGYTVAWDGDVSEPGFSHKNGFAIMPFASLDRVSQTDRARLERVEQGQAGTTPSVPKPGPEQNVTQEIRQAGFENFSTTDDHGMHLTGIVKDQNGTKYYKTKNSWGTDRSTFGGYLNMSESYVKAKTLFILVNKNAIPPAILAKLGL
jgi:bleomycin hydrolase